MGAQSARDIPRTVSHEFQAENSSVYVNHIVCIAVLFVFKNLIFYNNIFKRELNYLEFHLFAPGPGPVK